MKNKQLGMSLISLVFFLAVLGFAGVMAAQVFPTLIEKQAITKAASKAAEGATVAEVRAIFDRAASVEDIHSIAGKDLDIRKEGDKTIVLFAYNREIHIAGPAHLLLKYAGRSQ
jgi:Tfp pilus assembly protein FimT